MICSAGKPGGPPQGPMPMGGPMPGGPMPLMGPPGGPMGMMPGNLYFIASCGLVLVNIILSCKKVDSDWLRDI